MEKETRQRFSKNVSFRDCSCNSVHPTPANHLVSPGTWCRPCKDRSCGPYCGLGISKLIIRCSHRKSVVILKYTFHHIEYLSYNWSIESDL